MCDFIHKTKSIVIENEQKRVSGVPGSEFTGDMSSVSLRGIIAAVGVRMW
jgi:hypothetical protein